MLDHSLLMKSRKRFVLDVFDMFATRTCRVCDITVETARHTLVALTVVFFGLSNVIFLKSQTEPEIK